MSDSSFDLNPLAPAQWALWAAFGDVLTSRRVQVALRLPAPVIPQASEAVNELLARYEALVSSLEHLPGVLIPVQRVDHGNHGPSASVTTRADGITVDFEVPMAMVDAHTLAVLAEQIDAVVHGRPVEEPELDWFDVHDWNERRIARRQRPLSPPARLKHDRDSLTRAYEYERTELAASTVQTLRTLAEHLGVDVANVLAAALTVLAARLPDYRPAVGRVLSGRSMPETAAVVGRLDLLVPVAVRLDVRDARELVEQTRTALVAARAGMDADPFAVARAQVDAVTDARAWFGVSTAPSEDLRVRLPHARITTHGEDPGPCPVLFVVEADRIVVRHLAGTLPDQERLWLGPRLDTVLRRFDVADSGSPESWNVISAAEKAWIDAALTCPRASGPEPGPQTLVQRIHRMVVARPDAIAIVDGDQILTYAELDLAASRLAAWLVNSPPDSLIGLVPGSLSAFVVGALGIMTAGCGFLPIDERWPSARRRRLLDLAGTTTVITDADVVTDRDGPKANDVVDAALPGGLAYAISTSGTTGEPKLVGVEHRNLCAYADSIAALVPMPPGTRVSSPAAPTVDLGYTTLFPALCQGATVVAVPTDARMDPAEFEAFVTDSRIDILKITPSHLEALSGTEISCLPQRTLVLGGEPASLTLLRRIRDQRPDLEVVNHYGPTETTIGVVGGGWSAADLGDDPLSLGRPLAGADARVVASSGPAPVGVPGELRVSGPQVARGYLHDPRLTADRFRPTSGGGREYLTGDVVILGHDALLRFRGRRDDQVKIRGHRVEPLEVERELAAHPAVRQAVVLVDGEGGQRRLLAFAAAETDAGALRDHLATRLPESWLPATTQVLDRFPLTANGKVDRAALLRIWASTVATASPRHDLDRVLVAIWSHLLGLPAIGSDANVFESGGHSLSVTRAASWVREYLDTDVTVALFFSHPTITRFADALLSRPDADRIERRASIVVRVLNMPDAEVAAVAAEADGRRRR